VPGHVGPFFWGGEKMEREVCDTCRHGAERWCTHPKGWPKLIKDKDGKPVKCQGWESGKGDLKIKGKQLELFSGG